MLHLTFSEIYFAFYVLVSILMCNFIHKIMYKILKRWTFRVLERIKTIYIICNGKNDFGVRTNRFSNRILERIMVENRGSTVLWFRKQENLEELPLSRSKASSSPNDACSHSSATFYSVQRKAQPNFRNRVTGGRALSKLQLRYRVISEKDLEAMLMLVGRTFE